MSDLLTQPERRHRPGSAAGTLWLVPVLEAHGVEARALPERETVIGSAVSSDIRLDVPGVEARHCSITVENGRAVLTAHSRMTWIDNGPVRKAVLRPGQRLAIGPVEFEVQQRSPAIAPTALDQVDLLRRLLTNELGPLRIQSAHAGVSSPSAAVSSNESARSPERSTHAREEDGESDAQRLELDRQRRLVQELKASVHEQALSTIQQIGELCRTRQAAREELEAVRRAMELERAALNERRSVLDQRQEELERRSGQIAEDEQRLCTRRSELDESIGQVEEERREQYHRERLLQQRIEELNHAEAALAAREAELLRRQNELDAERSASATPRAESPPLHEDWSRERSELEATIEALRTTLSEKDEEIERWQNEATVRQRALDDRNAEAARQEADLERRIAELTQTQHHLNRTRTELDDRARSLSELKQQLESEREALADRRDQVDAASQALAAQQQAADARCQKLDQLEDTLSRRTAELNRTDKELAEREQALRQPEQALADRPDIDGQAQYARQAAAPLDHDGLEHRSSRENEFQLPGRAIASRSPAAAQEELEHLRRSLAEEQSRLDQQAQSLREQQESLEADRARFRDAQEKLRDQLARLDAARVELAEEQARLASAREQFHREREAFLEEQAQAPEDLESRREDPGRDVPIDTYEVGDAPPGAESDDFEEEILEDAKGSANHSLHATNDEIIGGSGDDELRCRLAELFGVPAAELNARARHQRRGSHAPAVQAPVFSPVGDAPEVKDEPAVIGTDSEPAGESSVTNAPVESRTADNEVDESAAADPVAAYMEKLLARSRQVTQGARFTPPPMPVKPSSRHRAPEASPAGKNGETDAAGSSPAVEPVIQTTRKRPDSIQERAHIDAFRDLANLSARTAVARHHSSSHRNRFVALAVLTAVLLVTWIVLTSAHFWTGESYTSWGLLAAAATCASAYYMLNSLSRLQSYAAVQSGEPIADAQDPFLKIVRAFARFAERLSFRGGSDVPLLAAEEPVGDRVDG